MISLFFEFLWISAELAAIFAVDASPVRLARPLAAWTADATEPAEIRLGREGDAGKAARRRAAARLRRDLRRVRAREGGRAGLPLLAMRRAVLPGALPAGEQHPGLADADGAGAPRGGLRGLV